MTGRLALLGAAMAVAGCGIIPDPATGVPVRVTRAGLDVLVTVPGWDRPKTRIVMCAAQVPTPELGDIVPTPIARPGCLEMATEHVGVELWGSYSFRSASATRLAAFDRAPDWHVILVGMDQRAPRFTQSRVAGGPVEVR